MAGGMRSVGNGVILLFTVAFVITTKSRLAVATQHEVGGSQGWDLTTDFNTWASGSTFNVGDTLSFKYSPGLHSVVQLGSESDYKSCSIGSPVNSWNGGSNVVKLSKAGTMYFACGTPGHCSGGMKVKITVLPQGAKSPSSSASPSTPTSSTASGKGNADQSAASPLAPSPPAIVVIFLSILPMVLL